MLNKVPHHEDLYFT